MRLFPLLILCSFLLILLGCKDPAKTICFGENRKDYSLKIDINDGQARMRISGSVNPGGSYDLYLYIKLKIKEEGSAWQIDLNCLVADYEDIEMELIDYDTDPVINDTLIPGVTYECIYKYKYRHLLSDDLIRDITNKNRIALVTIELDSFLYRNGESINLEPVCGYDYKSRSVLGWMLKRGTK